MRTVSVLIAATVVLAAMMLSPSRAADAADETRAARCFAEARELSARDAGRTWGVPLAGPMLFVDAGSRAVYANRADANGVLVKHGGVWTGTLPDDVTIANTATTWSGVKWTMILWPLPDDAVDRARLMMHECYHRIQDDVHLPATVATAPHLDGAAARTWMELEWNALAVALLQTGSARREAVRDALLFRAARLHATPDAAENERKLDMNEGLAEYTGRRVAAGSEPLLRVAAIAALDRGRTRPSYVRSFAYASGPAYGALLDGARPGWRSSLTASSDLGHVLAVALKITLPADPTAEATRRGEVYGRAAIVAAEALRAEEHAAVVARYKARLVDGPVLRVPFTAAGTYSFNPNDVVPLGDAGTVYESFELSDAWGVLSVSDGAFARMESGHIAAVQVVAPADAAARPLKGEGWTLELKPGWTVAPGSRAGDFEVRQSAP